MNSDFPTPTVYRRFIDVAPLLATAMENWRKQAMLAKVRVEQIALESLPRLWIHPESVFTIATRFVLEAIEASIAGSLIEVELRTADENHEWIALSVRDWAGGKPDGWTIDSSTQRLVKQLDGYIDVANQPGRGTICSLHLPSGNLQGWLCRQPHSALGYYISWNPRDLFLPSNQQSWKIDEAIQSSLQSQGSIVPSGEHAYFLACSMPIDENSIKATIKERLCFGPDTQKRGDELALRVDYIGPMREFMHRLESAIPTSTIDIESESANSKTYSTIRIDSPHQEKSVPSGYAKRPKYGNPPTTRMRPRRVNNAISN